MYLTEMKFRRSLRQVQDKAERCDAVLLWNKSKIAFLFKVNVKGPFRKAVRISYLAQEMVGQCTESVG